ncbi:hypothetical protein [Rhizobium sp. RCC_161_2]|uniref:hypothetical protein n=1 Tax=Rhizobium sp. RCC_161_2 TaxID=3239219 RepID=UPI0035245760
MTSYCSFLIANPLHCSLIESHAERVGWPISFLPDPSQRFWFHEGGTTIISHPQALGSQVVDGIPGQLLLINTAEEAVANNIVQLICAAYDIIEGNPGERVALRSVFPLPDDTAERDSIYDNLFRKRGFFEHFVGPSELAVAVATAAMAWSDRSLIYAIHKLSRSYATESITWWSAHPRYGQMFEKHSSLHSAHVGTSIAINLAFSAIEELQLQVKSSARNKRWLDLKAGQWNPTVLEDLRVRLRAAHIDPDSTMTWIVRGDRSLAETEITPVLGIPTPYSDGQTVRDVEVTLPDALHICSFIRNYMTAHRFGEASPFLGPYEVHNVQSLARQLILCACGLWRVSTENLLKSSW